MALHGQTRLFFRATLYRFGNLAMLDVGSLAATGHEIDEFRLAGKRYAGISNDFCKHGIAGSRRYHAVKFGVEQYPFMRIGLLFHAVAEINEFCHLIIRVADCGPSGCRHFDEGAGLDQIARRIAAIAQFRAGRCFKHISPASGAGMGEAKRLQRAQCLAHDRATDAIFFSELSFRGQAGSDRKSTACDG